jgi:hypothetical protein
MCVCVCEEREEKVYLLFTMGIDLCNYGNQ